MADESTIRVKLADADLIACEGVPAFLLSSTDLDVGGVAAHAALARV